MDELVDDADASGDFFDSEEERFAAEDEWGAAGEAGDSDTQNRRSVAEGNGRADAESPPDQRPPLAEALAAIIDSLPDVDRKIVTHWSRSDRRNWTAPLVTELGLTPDHIRVKKQRIVRRIKAKLRALGYEIAADGDLMFSRDGNCQC